MNRKFPKYVCPKCGGKMCSKRDKNHSCPKPKRVSKKAAPKADAE